MADRELVALVAEKVMGWHAVEVVPEFTSPHQWPMFDRNQSKVYSTRFLEPRFWNPLIDANAAMEVLGKFGRWKVARYINGYSMSVDGQRAVFAGQFGLGVCKAALLGQGSQL